MAAGSLVATNPPKLHVPFSPGSAGFAILSADPSEGPARAEHRTEHLHELGRFGCAVVRDLGPRLRDHFGVWGVVTETRSPEPLVADEAVLAFADQRRLTNVRESAGDPRWARALERLRRDVANDAQAGTWCVTQKSSLLPGLDPHDYCTLSEYFWPDPDRADGLPWVLRDGHINPSARADSDADRLRRMANASRSAALLAHLDDDECAAERSAELIAAWFLDPPTAMRPHLRFASLIPGQETPPDWGLIRAHHFLRVIDATTLLAERGWWDDAHDRALREWWNEFLDWTLQSHMWPAELARGNNHTTWVLALVLGLARHLGHTDLTKELSELVPGVVTSQVLATGEQPIESSRSRGYFYCCFNLEGLAVLLDLAAPAIGDLWEQGTPTGSRMRSALRWLLPYLAEPSSWPTPFHIEWDSTVGAAALHRITARCRDLQLASWPVDAPHLTRPGLHEWLVWDSGKLPEPIE